jgi:hypothetical protein
VLVVGWWWRRAGGETYDVLTIYPAFTVSNEFLFSFVLLVAFFNCAFQDPGQGFGNHDISLIDDAISSAAGFITLRNAAAVATSAVARGIGGDRRRSHDLMVEREGLKRLENCSCHFER